MPEDTEARSTPDRCRRFTLLDAMILVAAGAAALALTRPALVFLARDVSQIQVPALNTWQGWKTFLFGANQLALNFSRFCNLLLLGFVVCFLLAFLVIRLRRPHPPLRDLACQPGFAACAAALVACIAAFALPGVPMLPGIAQVVMIAGAPLAWTALLITRRWRPEPGWIDYLGRVIGALWIASSIAHVLFMRAFF